MATLLNIKLLMRADRDGGLEVMEKVRGTKAAVQRLADHIVEEVRKRQGRILAVAHSDCETKAHALIERIRQLVPLEECIVSEMGPVIGTYAGEGGIMVAY